MSASPPKADIGRRELNVRFVPKADIAPVLHLMLGNSDLGASGNQNNAQDDFDRSDRCEANCQPSEHSPTSAVGLS